ncbi:Gfo/Idh/MocA family protein [Actinokineospora cianjurensis]|uniref:UDP-N-acetyl-2-amino-2-deoxyglucuronate dehydrogenase n=1 Tax=Actinokineospora cianjurensis TaxID=585224 RepID=A0A421B2W8_9PSEU|nr:Gfo/Idh/MocA family oxidoreductase [Actinokineospora cianjurensis]RLK58776.1 UDP-N-acetyl-2-amino-2-deoxyglucuronate dehydrogenase [Actinokineospora cianjurensis]
MAELLTLPRARQRASTKREGKLRAAVVGLGKQGREDHIPGLLASDAAELVAICDDDPTTLAVQTAELGVPGFDDAVTMFDTVPLDFVVVCVPHHAGHSVIVAAAERGIHILKEKPFATTLEEAHELLGVCERAGVHLMVTLQRRFNPIYTSFQQLADQIGTPFVVDAAYTLHIPDPSEGWRGLAGEAGGGCVIDMGYHIVDMILWYFGLPDRVQAESSVAARPDRDYDAEDTALIHFSYDSGLYGSLLLSRFIGPKTEEIRLVGTHGIVHLERGRLQRLTNDGQVVESLVREQSWPAAAASQVNYFARVIEGLRPNISSPRDNLAHHAFIHACYESARTHLPISPKELL